jgi:single-strand DNA-binding protein
MSNVFSFTGSLGRNAELKNVNGQDLLNFAVANSVGFGDKKTTLWVDATLWGQRAVKAAPYLLKGQSVFVSGELTTREYQAKDGSGTKTALTLNVTVLDLVGGKKQDAQPAPVPVQAVAPPVQHSGAAYQAAQNGNAYDDDIPF